MRKKTKPAHSRRARPRAKPAPRPMAKPAPVEPIAVAEPVSPPVPAGPNRLAVILASSTRGDLERRGAPTRAAAFRVIQDLSIEALARGAERRWLHGEVISVRVEQHLGLSRAASVEHHHRGFCGSVVRWLSQSGLRCEMIAVIIIQIMIDRESVFVI
jgi:hypothetical protein